VSDPVIDQLAEVWTSIIELGEGLTEREWKSGTELPGWSVQDNLTHVSGTELMMAGTPAPDVNIRHSDHLHNSIGELNELWVESRRNWLGADVLAEFKTVASNRLADYRSMTEVQLDTIGPTPLGPAPFREFIVVRVMDSWAHEQDMRRAVHQPGHLAGPAVVLSVGRVTRAMPMVVGKRAEAQDGSSIVFIIEGDAGGIVSLAVDGRARLTDEPIAEPTVSLTMDVETYAALGFGRWTAEKALAEGRVTITGDRDLGNRIVTSMNFMN